MVNQMLQGAILIRPESCVQQRPFPSTPFPPFLDVLHCQADGVERPSGLVSEKALFMVVHPHSSEIAGEAVNTAVRSCDAKRSSGLCSFQSRSPQAPASASVSFIARCLFDVVGSTGIRIARVFLCRLSNRGFFVTSTSSASRIRSDM
jgi:hypothetical protein